MQLVRLTLLIGLLFCGSLALAQSPAAGLRLERSIAGPVADAALDNLGNLYLLSAGGQLKKFVANGDSMAVFNQVRRNGPLHTLDVSNPLRPLLFYRDFGQVVLLDRFLAPQLTLDLRRIGILQPTAVGQSFDNKIWVFDAVANKLKKVDEQGNLLLETPDLRAVFPEGLHPQRIFDQNGWVYLSDPAEGLFVFDYYGTFKRKIPVPGWRNLLITDQTVLGFADGAVHTYSLSTLMQGQQAIPTHVQGCSDMRMGNKQLLALCPEGVRLYRWSN